MAADIQSFIVTSVTIRVGEVKTISCGVQWASSDNQSVAATSNPSAYEVTITGVSVGTARLTAPQADNICVVTVEAASTPIEDLKKNGEKFYPTTVSTAVFRPDGTAVEEALGSQPTKVSQLENDANYVYAADAGEATNVVPDVGTARLQDGSVTKDKLSKDLYIYTPWNVTTPITLPAGNYTHDVQLFFAFSAGSAAGGCNIQNTAGNLTGTTWMRRFLGNNGDSHMTYGQQSETNLNNFVYLASNSQLGASGGACYVSGKIFVYNAVVRYVFDFHCNGAEASGHVDGEAALATVNTSLKLQPARNNGTVNACYGRVISERINP